MPEDDPERTAYVTKINDLESKLVELGTKFEQAQEKLERAQWQINQLTKMLFGKKSEQTPNPGPFGGGASGQLELELTSEEDAALESAPVPAPKKKRGGSKPGRKIRVANWREHLPVEEIEIIPLELQAAPEAYRRIGEKVCEKLERVPGKMIVQRLVRPTYVKIAEPYAAPITAPPLPDVIAGGEFGIEFLTSLVVDKYLNHLPLYRQAQIITREHRITVPQPTLCQAIAPIVACLRQELWSHQIVQMDLSPLRCLSRDHPGCSFLGQMWVAGVPRGDVAFQWDQTKEARVAEGIIPRDWKNVLQIDGGSELACYLKGGKGRKQAVPAITRAACWAHVRRKFYEAAENGCLLSKRLLKIINVLYRIEGEIKDHTDEERARVRSHRSARVMRGLHRRLQTILLKERPKSAVGQAEQYTLGQWSGLETYLSRGYVPIDNNSIDIRYPAHGRGQEELPLHRRCSSRTTSREFLQFAGQLPATRPQPQSLPPLALRASPRDPPERS